MTPCLASGEGCRTIIARSGRIAAFALLSPPSSTPCDLARRPAVLQAISDISMDRAAVIRNVLLLCLALAAASARADTPQYCDEYANQAVMSGAVNHDRACRQSGPRWALKYREHYDWCLGVPHNVAHAERLARQKAIQACKAAGESGEIGGGPVEPRRTPQ